MTNQELQCTGIAKLINNFKTLDRFGVKKSLKFEEIYKMAKEVQKEILTSNEETEE